MSNPARGRLVLGALASAARSIQKGPKKTKKQKATAEFEAKRDASDKAIAQQGVDADIARGKTKKKKKKGSTPAERRKPFETATAGLNPLRELGKLAQAKKRRDKNQ